jgi:hypothetical protein
LIERNRKEIFLHSLEDWISEVVKDKTNGHNDGIPPMIKEGFLCSMQANADYHKAVADVLNENGNKKLVVYHTLMSSVYSALLTEM